MSVPNELLPVLKRRHIINAVKEYSDYVEDLRGKSFESFLREDYLVDKRIETVLVDTEKGECIYDLVKDELLNHIEVRHSDNPSTKAVYRECDFDSAIDDLVEAIYDYIENNC